MNGLAMRGGPTLYGTYKYEQQHDAEYIVPPHYRSDLQLYRHQTNNNWIPPHKGIETSYFPTSHLQQNIWLDKKSHDRIQNWLSATHEYTGYRPPTEEEETLSSVRSNSAIDIINSNERSPVSEERSAYFPRYKSEERIQSFNNNNNNNNVDSSEEFKQSLAFRRYNSPDCIRRRYYSPRSDPTLNLPKHIQSSASYKQLSTVSAGGGAGYNEGYANSKEQSLNKSFYQAGKGNTFPRRSSKFTLNRSIPRHLISREPNMGQQMDKVQPLTYDGRVMLNPYANGSNTNNNNTDHKQTANDIQCQNDFTPKVNIDQWRTSQNPPDYEYAQIQLAKENKPVLAGRTFVLNGINLQPQDSKQHDYEINTEFKRDVESPEESFQSISAQVNAESNIGKISTNSLSSNEKLSSKSLQSSKGKQNDDPSTQQEEDQAAEITEKSRPIHVRVASAPATTDSKTLDRDLYWRTEFTKQKRRISYEVRKVKAFSWPKRAVLPVTCSDNIQFIGNVTRKQQPKDKNQTKLNANKNNDDDYCDEDDDFDNITVDELKDNESDISDIPPARPPLPADFQQQNQLNAYDVISLDSDSPERDEIVEEEPILVESKNDDFCQGFQKSFSHQYLSDHYASHSSLVSDHFRTHDLSKSVSMSLKDLIRIHEQEIARVNGGFSTRTLDKIDETDQNLAKLRTRKTSLGCEKDRYNSRLKRHTTIGLLPQDEHNKLVDSCGDSRSCCSEQDDFTDSLGHFIHDTSRQHHRISISSPTQCRSLGGSPIRRHISSSSDNGPLSPSTEGSFRSPPSTLPKPRKKRVVTTSSTVTPTVKSVVKPPIENTKGPLTHDTYSVDCGMSQVTQTVECAVQTEKPLERSVSYRKNEARVRQLTAENEALKKEFEAEREELTKKLQEQKKVANAYQKLEDRYRKKVYELQKAMKLCTCPTNRDYSGESDHSTYRPENSPSADRNDISVQKVDSILNQLESWLHRQTNGITYADSDISSLIGSNTAEEFYLRKQPSRVIPLDRIIDGIDATSV